MELLAPAGDKQKLIMAIEYGADAVYLASTRFGLRTFAGNFDLEQTRLLIETNQKHKFFNNFLKPETIYYIENNLANKKEDFTIMDVHTSTVYFGLKVDLSSYSYTEISKIAVLIDFLLDETIGYGSKNYQMWIREKIPPTSAKIIKICKNRKPIFAYLSSVSFNDLRNFSSLYL